MRFCAIASGSSGNCIYVGHKDTNILVDAGMSGKKIEEGLAFVGVSPSSIEAILITHDHIDHIQGAAIYAKRYKIPIFGTEKTLTYIKNHASGRFDESLLKPVKPDKGFSIGSLNIKPFSVSHDALDPVAYSISADGKKLGMATDLGEYTDYTIDNLKGSDALYIEANHDLNMLMTGSYPYSLKRRIDSKDGHLSNDACAQLVTRLQNNHLKHIVLAHLSLENNFEELAYETVRLAIHENWEYEEKPSLTVAHRSTPTKMVNLE